MCTCPRKSVSGPRTMCHWPPGTRAFAYLGTLAEISPHALNMCTASVKFRACGTCPFAYLATHTQCDPRIRWMCVDMPYALICPMNARGNQMRACRALKKPFIDGGQFCMHMGYRHMGYREHLQVSMFPIFTWDIVNIDRRKTLSSMSCLDAMSCLVCGVSTLCHVRMQDATYQDST